MGVEQHEQLKDHTKNPYHKVLVKHGYAHHETRHEQSRLSSNPKHDITKHIYKAPEGRGKSYAAIWHHHDGSKPSWFHYHEQPSNGIMAPGHGETKPGLDRDIADSANEWAKHTAKTKTEDVRHPMRRLVEGLSESADDTWFAIEYDRHGPEVGQEAHEALGDLASFLGLGIEDDPVMEGSDSYSVILFKPSARSAIEIALKKMAQDSDEFDEDDPYSHLPDDHSCLVITWDWKHFEESEAKHLADRLTRMGFRVQWDRPNHTLKIFKR